MGDVKEFSKITQFLQTVKTQKQPTLVTLSSVYLWRSSLKMRNQYVIIFNYPASADVACTEHSKLLQQSVSFLSFHTGRMCVPFAHSSADKSKKYLM
jgi:hypothetical protein